MLLNDNDNNYRRKHCINKYVNAIIMIIIN